MRYDVLTTENVTRYDHMCEHVFCDLSACVCACACAKGLAEHLQQTLADHANTKIGSILTVEGDDLDDSPGA